MPGIVGGNARPRFTMRLQDSPRDPWRKVLEQTNLIREIQLRYPSFDLA